MMSIFNKGRDARETALKIFSDAIKTLVMSVVMSNNGISEEELITKVKKKLLLDNTSYIIDEIKALENLGVIERKGNEIVLTEFGTKVSKVLKDMLEIYYKTFTSLDPKKH